MYTDQHFHMNNESRVSLAVKNNYNRLDAFKSILRLFVLVLMPTEPWLLVGSFIKRK